MFKINLMENIIITEWSLKSIANMALARFQARIFFISGFSPDIQRTFALTILNWWPLATYFCVNMVADVFGALMPGRDVDLSMSLQVMLMSFWWQISTILTRLWPSPQCQDPVMLYKKFRVPLFTHTGVGTTHCLQLCCSNTDVPLSIPHRFSSKRGTSRSLYQNPP